MTATNGLNTLEYAERLMRAGVPEEQAKAQALVLYEIINSNLATKQDLKDVDLKIEQVRADLKKDIEQTRKDLRKDIKILEDKMALKLLIYSSGVIGGCSSFILGGIFAMARLGLLSIQ